jgi:hypothetical protein
MKEHITDKKKAENIYYDGAGNYWLKDENNYYWFITNIQFIKERTSNGNN